MKIIRAFIAGYKDGLESPYELGSGLTFPSPLLNKAYDTGVNVGQKIALRKQGEA